MSGEWHTEANVQAALVTALAADRWRIVSVANTATKEHGIDVIASRDSQTVGIEVKGFPSRDYADPARANKAKRTSTQAGHWYSQAVLAAMRLRGKEPTWRSVIVLPDYPTSRVTATCTLRQPGRSVLRRSGCGGSTRSVWSTANEPQVVPGGSVATGLALVARVRGGSTHLGGARQLPGGVVAVGDGRGCLVRRARVVGVPHGVWWCWPVAHTRRRSAVTCSRAIGSGIGQVALRVNRSVGPNDVAAAVYVVDRAASLGVASLTPVTQGSRTSARRFMGMDRAHRRVRLRTVVARLTLSAELGAERLEVAKDPSLSEVVSGCCEERRACVAEAPSRRVEPEQRSGMGT